MASKLVTLRVPDESWRAAKVEAARRGMTLTAFVLAAIAEKIAQQAPQ